MVTLKDIARQAGVSIMTVSRVMNDQQGKVSPQTAEKVRRIAEEMGYIPNSSARSLAARSSKIIAVILRDEPAVNPLEIPYNSAFLGRIIRILPAYGYSIMVHFVKDFSDITFWLKSWNAQGAVFLGIFDREIRQIRSDNQIPLIFTDSYSNVRRIDNVGDMEIRIEIKNDIIKSINLMGDFFITGDIDAKIIKPLMNTPLERTRISEALPETLNDVIHNLEKEDFISLILQSKEQNLNS